MYLTFTEIGQWLVGVFFLGVAVGGFGFYWLASRPFSKD